MAFVPVSGTAGRVRNGSNVIAGIDLWELTFSSTPIPLPHFEIVADAAGVLYPGKLVGLGDSKVRLQGIFNTDTTDNTITGTPGLRNGLTVVLDLYYSKAGAVGFENVTGFVSGLVVTTDVNNRPVSFTCDVEVSGPPPAPGAITP